MVRYEPRLAPPLHELDVTSCVGRVPHAAPAKVRCSKGGAGARNYVQLKLEEL